jgi:hypothetical protein
MERINARHYPSMCLEELRNVTTNISQDSLAPIQHLNPDFQEYVAGILTTRQRRSVYKKQNYLRIQITPYRVTNRFLENVVFEIKE